ncbi:MAG: hypothetical protein CFH18_00316 [Alphaproteobacteria bacterium MarineAlpha5_Bin8]|mgnify:CR=1 FL=1|nr:MAG: hypothetical protein CFH17_00599 [Alphaproteobacteria bacterium MarineAlpha5_Bin7]PPR48049.1 MAG: hypothetical protein CFH18_00316 [Alphaproteobacteria bacterium MarineAlpha5_Bin8]PPR54664.1 MAG: hypothetical protein CFH16_00247 [Alphaproteobacteria bacterium MarineAlpha5_Bin6]|tara:strand:+ start:5882 stop:6427 length:546 start_codon:yes stop_codon:yes gene_type:complete
MIKIKRFYILILVITIFLTSCSQIRESAGVNRKSIDEFRAYENPPLILPPDFNLTAPDQLKEKNIDDVEKDLAKEILFGLEVETQEEKKEFTTMNTILNKSEATNVSDDIRRDIDENFASKKKTNNIFKIEWENEQEVLDAVNESKRIRDKNFEGESIAEGEVPIKTEKSKIKKKKRFIFF